MLINARYLFATGIAEGLGHDRRLIEDEDYVHGQ